MDLCIVSSFLDTVSATSVNIRVQKIKWPQRTGFPTVLCIFIRSPRSLCQPLQACYPFLALLQLIFPSSFHPSPELERSFTQGKQILRTQAVHRCKVHLLSSITFNPIGPYKSQKAPDKSHITKDQSRKSVSFSLTGPSLPCWPNLSPEILELSLLISLTHVISLHRTGKVILVKRKSIMKFSCSQWSNDYITGLNKY